MNTWTSIALIVGVTVLMLSVNLLVEFVENHWGK